MRPNSDMRSALLALSSGSGCLRGGRPPPPQPRAESVAALSVVAQRALLRQPEAGCSCPPSLRDTNAVAQPTDAGIPLGRVFLPRAVRSRTSPAEKIGRASCRDKVQ